MRAIQKHREPFCLKRHRLRAGSTYDNLPTADKQRLRESLVTEQGGICCYCMGRIGDDDASMKIEHWASQQAHAARRLAYANLLAACLGGQGLPPEKQHCDTRKGMKTLAWNPADPSHVIETRIRYEIDGTVRADDTEFDQQLNDVLNLNLATLKAARGRVMETLADWWKQQKARAKGPVPRDVIERQLARWTGGSPLPPYSGVAVVVLRRRLAKAA